MNMLAFLLLLAVGAATANTRYLISAPNVFHVGVPENVSILVYGTAATVKVYLQDYPQRKRIFSQVQADFAQDTPGMLTVKVNPADVPDQGSLDKQYVYLVAECNHPAKMKFKKEIKILLSFRNGVILIQTDKPIYTPKQTVNIRVIPLDFNLFPANHKISIIVKNPQGIRVQQWKDLSTDTGFISKPLDLEDFVLKGNWTIEAYYDDLTIHNTSTVFEVREYVLPKFSVKIACPPEFLQHTKAVHIAITAKYTYGKAVQGSAAIRVKILGFDNQEFPLNPFYQTLNAGTVQFRIQKQEIVAMYPNLGFPEGARLQVAVDVTEKSTGITQRAVNSVLFTSTPFVIKFTKTAKYFMPGLQFPIKVVVTGNDGKVRAGIRMKISAKAVIPNGNKKNRIDVGQSALRQNDDAANKGLTNRDGVAEFLVDVPRNAISLEIKAETNDPRKGAFNGVKEYVVSTYTSPSGYYLMVRQRKPSAVGRRVVCEVFNNNDKVNLLAYMVVARGQIVHQDLIKEKMGVVKTIVFEATPKMSPSSRFIAYYITADGHVVSDTTTLDISDSLPNKISIKDNEHILEKWPGETYTAKVLGEKNTHVGLLGIDQSVYLLANKNRLTPESVFEKLQDLDLGCGVASGKDTKEVFKNSGLSVISGSFKSDERKDFSCQDAPQKRKKRSLDLNVKVRCCSLGNTTDANNRNCIRRILDIHIPDYDNNPNKLKQCRTEFLKCCKARFGSKGMGGLARSFGGIDEINFGEMEMPIEEIVEITQVRSYFPETWFFEDKVISDNEGRGVCQQYLHRPTCASTSLTATVPDTITTWIVQAIAVSNKSGFGIAKPLHIRTFRDFFVSLDMPYSVQRGEQISILATAFNYGRQDYTVQFFLQTHEGFCSSSAHNPRRPFKLGSLKIKGNGGSGSLPITIVPIKYGYIPIKVYIFNGADQDAVERKLLVVPEGIEERKTQSYVLDPQGVLRDPKQKAEALVTIKNSTFPSQRHTSENENKQIVSIRIEIPKKSIPESISAMMSFTGNMIGPVVTNLINGGLEALLRMPTGCGEQTMIYLSPNVYVLQYLSNTNQVTGPVETKAYKFINKGYQRELNYRRKDGSFSAWGNTRPGSTWLTAFVIKVFCEANQFGNAVQIDKNLMCTSVNWLIQHQRGDGAFPEVHHVIHKEMVGGVYQNGDIAITAFVVTALLECQCQGLVKNAATARAVTYLENNLANLQDTYTQAVTAYALAMADSKKKYEANDKLTKTAIYNPATSSRHWNAGGHALNIETAAYVLLAQLKLNRLSYAGPIVTWLTEQKNSGGGFKSTTDTCVALQALAKYSEGTAGAKLDLRISIEPTNLDPNAGIKPKQIRISNQNALLQQSVDIRPYLRPEGEEFAVTSVGTGVAQMQVSLNYNLAASKEERCAFEIKYTIDKRHSNPSFSQSDEPAKPTRKPRRKGKGRKRKNRRKNRKNRRKNRKNRKNRNKNKNKKNKKEEKEKKEKKKQKTEAPDSLIINICARYKKPGKTGMAIMDVGLITGYEVDKRSLKETAAKMNDTIANYEFSGRSVVFYLDSIDSAKPLCVGFKATRSFDIGLVYPVPIKVYDYYEPDDSCTKFYSLEKSTPDMGSCNGKSCKCSQDKCAALDPDIVNVDRLVQDTCAKYDYAVKAKVVYVDEDKMWLTYDIEVLEVIRSGNAKQLKKGEVKQFWKSGSCINPSLSKNDELLIMGRDKGGKYTIDSSSFVRVLKNNGQKAKIAELSTRVNGGECDD